MLAGPGSGKTFTLTQRILYLLRQGVSPETILVITFTKEAALSMQSRFQEMTCKDMGHFVSYPVNFGTFHSVFYHILKDSNTLASDRLLSGSDKKALLLPILETYAEKEQNRRERGRASSDSLGEDAAKVLCAISCYKNTMRLHAACRHAPAYLQSCFETVLWEYDRAVKKTGRVDFDDMLYSCMELLKRDAGIRRYWQRRFTHILIDEFQDINPVQYEVVKLLTDRPYNLFAVGDDDQSIYGFRGSEPDCMKRFQEEFHARQILLDVNYRSRREIVEASLAVIGENRNRFAKKLHAAHSEKEEAWEAARSEKEEAWGEAARERKGSQKKGRTDGDRGPQRQDAVRVRCFADSQAQYDYLLQTLLEQRGKEGSRAVLFRTNSYMQSFAARLKAADIPYEMREKAVSIYEHFIVTDVMCYLQIAHGMGKREQLLRIMNRPSRYISREAVEEGGVDIGRIAAHYERSDLPSRQKSNIIRELKKLEKQLACLARLPLKPAVSYICKAAGYDCYLREAARGSDEKWREWQELLEWLKEDGARHGTLKDWMRFQEDYKKETESESRRKPQPSEPPLQLLTVHGSKGLEFDSVWIPDCNERIFPHGRMPDEKAVEEERRIFYVAMTRAKKSLELLYLTGTKERPRLPSRFLNPLYSSTNSSNSQLSRNSSKASTTFSYSSSSSI